MTETTPCLICGKPDPDRGLACAHCLNRVDDDLAAIPTLTALAFAYLPAKAAPGGGTRGKPGSRPPIDLDQIDAQLGLDSLPVLEQWEILVRQMFGYSPYGPASLARTDQLAGCVTFLRANLARIAETRDFPLDDMSHEIHHVHARLRRFDPNHDNASPMSANCPADHPDHDGRDCGWRLRIDADNLRGVIVCGRCGTHWSADRLLLVALNSPHAVVWATPADCEAVTGIPARTLQRWADGGQLGRKGTLYDVGGAFRIIREGAHA